MPSRSKASFTLIELLIVIAIIAVLAVIVLLVINPAEILNRNRDSNRLSDVATLNTAINLYNTDVGGSLGTASTTYISVPDPSATSTAGDQCQGLGMPTLPSGWTYHCAASSTYKHTDGTGWIPLDFTTMSSGDPLGSLPVDPINQTSTGLYYTYTVQSSNYELTAIMESSKEKAKLETNPTLTDYPGVDAMGNDLALSALYSPSGLVGYWKFDEGTGTVAADSSENGFNGTLVNNPTWTTGKIGDALSFDGATTNVQTGSSFTIGSVNFTVVMWVNPPAAPDGWVLTQLSSSGGSTVWGIQVGQNGTRADFNDSSSTGWLSVDAPWYSEWGSGGFPISPNSWDQIAVVGTAASTSFYVNGVSYGTASIPVFDTGSNQPPTNVLQIGSNLGWGYYTGTIDDTRIYNRALSDAEVLALYNAER